MLENCRKFETHHTLPLIRRISFYLYKDEYKRVFKVADYDSEVKNNTKN